MTLIDRAKRSLQRTQDNYDCVQMPDGAYAPGDLYANILLAVLREPTDG